MTTSHTLQLTQALRAAICGDDVELSRVFTDDVVAWSPVLSVSSLEELSKAFQERETAFSDVEIHIDAVDVSPMKAIAEWRVSAVHSGPFHIEDDLTVEPTGRTLYLAGATFAEFRDDRIATMRTYFDDAALLEQVLEPI